MNNGPTAAPSLPAYLSAFRSVDWRWRLAQRQCNGNVAARRRRDHWVAAASALASEFEAYRLQRRAAPTNAAIVSAVRDASILAHDPTLLQSELRARILANEPATAISDRIAVQSLVIDAYEAVFFDVRPRLNATSWLRHRVLAPHMRPDGSVSDVGGLWMVAAIGGGIAALEVIVSCLPPTRRYIAEIDDYFNPAFDIPADVQLYVAGRCLSSAEAATPAFARLQDWLESTARSPMAVASFKVSPLRDSSFDQPLPTVSGDSPSTSQYSCDSGLRRMAA